MNRAIVAAMAGVLCLGVITPAFAAKTDGGDLGELADGNTAFALDLYARLAKEEGNLFFSPYSISTALAMTYAGARGDTATQMSDVLRFPHGGDALHGAFKQLGQQLESAQKRGKIALRVANALWPHEGYPFLKEYMAQVKRFYGVEIAHVNYAGAREAARKRINTWAEKMTEGKIKDLIPQGVLTPLTRLVLTNAIYFKGDWKHPFKKAATQKAPFKMTNGKAKQVQLMHQQEQFRYAERDGVQVLELPYDEGQLSMIVVLPKAIDGLADLEEELSREQLTEWTGLMRKRKVRVFLPRFEMTSQFSLNRVLIDMGMRAAFEAGERADFSGMDGTRKLYIQAVLHKAFVAVDEKGTEAAAATAVVSGMRSAARPRPVPVFRADHPFLFYIRESGTGSILFMGRMTEPQD